MQPNFTEVWTLIHSETESRFLPPPDFRVETIAHNEPQLNIKTFEGDPQRKVA
jgi:hypothetical protein